MGKLLTIDEVDEEASFFRSKGRTIITTNGVFDILHLGHCRHLKKAKELGDFLIVGVNSDDSAKKIRGYSPVNNESDRAELLSYLKPVDFVFIFDEENPIEFIKRLKPDIHIKGGDYKNKKIVEEKIVKSYGGKIEIIDFEKGYSTTSLIDKIKKSRM